jgi:hypothetical protein
MKTIIIAAALISETVAAQAQSGAVQSSPQPSSSGVHSYWTPERMKQAKPVDVGRQSPAPSAPSAPPEPLGNPGAAGGMLPSKQP